MVDHACIIENCYSGDFGMLLVVMEASLETLILDNVRTEAHVAQ